MQRKDEPTYCASCQDEDVHKFDNKTIKKPVNGFTTTTTTANGNGHEQATTNNHHHHHHHHKSARTGGDASSSSPSDTPVAVQILNEKIAWATSELVSSNNNLRYIIELCEMIKAASEAIISLRKLNEHQQQ